MLDPAFKLLAQASRKKDKGIILEFLLGQTEQDWRLFYLDDSDHESGVQGLVDGKCLAEAVSEVLGSSKSGQGFRAHEDVFYTCWRLLETEVPAGLRYHYRTMAFYNFAATMSLVFLISSPFLGWYAYQISVEWGNNCILIQIGSAVITVILSLLFAKRFFSEYKKYRK